MQDDLERNTPVHGLPSRPSSRNAFNENDDMMSSAEAELAHLRHDSTTIDALRSGSNLQGSSAAQHIGPPSSYTYAAALGSSLSRSTTPDPQLVARVPSPCPTPIGGGRVSAAEKRSITSPDAMNGASSGISESADLVAALSGMNLSADGVLDRDNHLPSQVESDVDNHQTYLLVFKEVKIMPSNTYTQRSLIQGTCRKQLTLIPVKGMWVDLILIYHWIGKLNYRSLMFLLVLRISRDHLPLPLVVEPVFLVNTSLWIAQIHHLLILALVAMVEIRHLDP